MVKARNKTLWLYFQKLVVEVFEVMQHEIAFFSFMDQEVSNWIGIQKLVSLRATKAWVFNFTKVPFNPKLCATSNFARIVSKPTSLHEVVGSSSCFYCSLLFTLSLAILHNLYKAVFPEFRQRLDNVFLDEASCLCTQSHQQFNFPFFTASSCNQSRAKFRLLVYPRQHGFFDALASQCPSAR